MPTGAAPGRSCGHGEGPRWGRRAGPAAALEEESVVLKLWGSAARGAVSTGWTPGYGATLE